MTTQLLNPSFRVDWQINSNDVTETVIRHLENVASPIRTSSKLAKKQRRKKNRKKKNLKPESDSTISRIKTGGKEKETIELSDSNNGKAGQSPENSQATTSNIFKDHAVIGISKVLRYLQERKLSIALFDRSFLRPSAIAQFIGSACITSGAHCVCLDGLSDRLAPILNLKSASVFGIRKVDGGFPESIDSLIKAATLAKPVVYVSQDIDGEEGGRKKRRKRIQGDASLAGNTDICESASSSYVEPTVLIQHRTKKKKK